MLEIELINQKIYSYLEKYDHSDLLYCQIFMRPKGLYKNIVSYLGKVEYQPVFKNAKQLHFMHQYMLIITGYDIVFDCANFTRLEHVESWIINRILLEITKIKYQKEIEKRGVNPKIKDLMYCIDSSCERFFEQQKLLQDNYKILYDLDTDITICLIKNDNTITLFIKHLNKDKDTYKIFNIYQKNNNFHKQIFNSFLPIKKKEKN